MTKRTLSIIAMFLCMAIFTASSTFADDGEVIKAVMKIIDVKPQQCPEKEECYCLTLDANKQTPKMIQPLRYSLARFCLSENDIDGKRIFIFTSFDNEKNIVDEGKYVEGKRHGLWTSWHQNGIKAGESIYSAGKQIGQFTTWHDNGKVAVKGQYKDNNLDGIWLYYDKGGNLENRLVWDNGTLVTKDK